jgi:hypothetical protein
MFFLDVFSFFSLFFPAFRFFFLDKKKMPDANLLILKYYKEHNRVAIVNAFEENKSYPFDETSLKILASMFIQIKSQEDFLRDLHGRNSRLVVECFIEQAVISKLEFDELESFYRLIASPAGGVDENILMFFQGTRPTNKADDPLLQAAYFLTWGQSNVKALKFFQRIKESYRGMLWFYMVKSMWVDELARNFELLRDCISNVEHRMIIVDVFSFLFVEMDATTSVSEKKEAYTKFIEPWMENMYTMDELASNTNKNFWPAVVMYLHSKLMQFYTMNISTRKFLCKYGLELYSIWSQKIESHSWTDMLFKETILKNLLIRWFSNFISSDPSFLLEHLSCHPFFLKQIVKDFISREQFKKDCLERLVLYLAAIERGMESAESDSEPDLVVDSDSDSDSRSDSHSDSGSDMELDLSALDVEVEGLHERRARRKRRLKKNMNFVTDPIFVVQGVIPIPLAVKYFKWSVAKVAKLDDDAIIRKLCPRFENVFRKCDYFKKELEWKGECALCKKENEFVFPSECFHFFCMDCYKRGIYEKGNKCVSCSTEYAFL